MNLLTSREQATYSYVTSIAFLDKLGVGSESHCRYAWSHQIKKDNSQWRAIGHRSSNKRTYKLKDIYLDAEAFVPEKGERRCSVDCYLSPNQFWDWRNTKQLASLNASWLEIDTIEHKCLTLSQEKIVIREVFEQLESSEVPLPSGYVLSGSGGIHLYWLYTEVSAYFWRVKAWREIATSLIDSLSGGDLWEVDAGASRDPSRVLRIPGTIHSKSGRTVKAFLNNEASYSFEDLALKCNISLEKPRLEIVVEQDRKVAAKPSKSVKKQTDKVTGRHTIRMWWSKVFNHVHHHARLTGVKEGKRDSTAFILFVALKHMVNENIAWERIKKINSEIINLEPKELETYLATAQKVQYKYSKATLSMYLSKQLGMDVSFLFDNRCKLSANEIRSRQQEGAELTAIKKSTQTLQNLVSKAYVVARSQTLTQALLVQSSQKSLSTVKRYWAAIKLAMLGAISCPSIYPPPKKNEPMCLKAVV